MSIVLPAGLPASGTLSSEGIDVLSERVLVARGQRPLHVCLVNLMPNKIAAETQIARLLGATPVPVEVTLCVPDGYRPRTGAEHVTAFYQPWSRIRDARFDGVIVTGAPVEILPFEEVAYWSDLCAIFDWARERNIAAYYICWAAQAALHHFHAVPKHRLPEKMFGVFRHRVTGAGAQLLRGFGGAFPAPVSRHTEVKSAELPADAGLATIAESPEAGLCLVEEPRHRAVYMFNHLEYDAGSLRDEFVRDRAAGKSIAIPRNYFPGDDPSRAPTNVWRPYGRLLFANWLAQLQRPAARPDDDPMIGWALAAGGPGPAQSVDGSALLIATANSLETVPGALRTLADLGLAPHAVRVHRQSGREPLVEVGLDLLPQSVIERVARRLRELPATSRIAFRTGGGGGWLLGHRAVADAQSIAPLGEPAAAA